MAAFAAGKWIQRSLAQSLAKEFGPQGVHVSHAIVDGFVDTPQVRELVKETNPDAMISPAAVSCLIHVCVLSANSLSDRGRLLVPAHAAKKLLYLGDGYQTLCREVVTV